MWSLRGFHGIYMESMRSPHGVYQESMESMRSPHGVYQESMESMWSLHRPVGECQILLSVTIASELAIGQVNVARIWPTKARNATIVERSVTSPEAAAS